MPLETTASNPQPSLITLSALTALATSCIQDTALLNGSEGGFLLRRSYISRYRQAFRGNVLH
jgi:hypothetical protein